jgi:hypothetical protein
VERETGFEPATLSLGKGFRPLRKVQFPRKIEDSLTNRALG